MLDLGYEVKCSTRNPEKLFRIEQLGAQGHLVDIDQADEDISAFLDSETLIINITSKNHAGFTWLREQIEKSPVKNLIFISSTSVYNNTNAMVTEDDKQENQQHPLYQIEQLFQQSKAFDTTILRLSGLIGYSRHPGRFFRNGKSINQADAPVNLIHRDDCIGLIQQIIQQQAWNQVFNGCADTHPTKREYYSYTRSLLGLPAPDINETSELSYKIVSNDKVKSLLNYRFIYPDLNDIHFDNESA